MQTSRGNLLSNDAYPNSNSSTDSLQSKSTSHKLPWGAQCIFNGCYTVITDPYFNLTPFNIPSVNCTLTDPAVEGKVFNDLSCIIEPLLQTGLSVQLTVAAMLLVWGHNASA